MEMEREMEREAGRWKGWRKGFAVAHKTDPTPCSETLRERHKKGQGEAERMSYKSRP